MKELILAVKGEYEKQERYFPILKLVSMLDIFIKT